MRSDVLLALGMLIILLGFTIFAVISLRQAEDLAGQKAVLEERVNRLEQENTQLKARLDDALRLLGEKIRDASRFETLYADVQGENARLKTRVKQLEEENQDLHARLENVTAERETYHAALRACFLQLSVYRQRAEACTSPG